MAQQGPGRTLVARSSHGTRHHYSSVNVSSGITLSLAHASQFVAYNVRPPSHYATAFVIFGDPTLLLFFSLTSFCSPSRQRCEHVRRRYSPVLESETNQRFRQIYFDEKMML
ncbi:hypothetical protein J6590_099453 [Homalodisca vitripennis]|nr:hypothetical protein J6590_099453 [Homalodisca vitripennis]